MTILRVEEELLGDGRFIPKLPWVEGSEEVMVVRKSSPEVMARALRHELRHKRYLGRQDLAFPTVKERRVKEEIASALLDYADARNRRELEAALDFYREEFELSEKVFNRYVNEVSEDLERWA